MSGERRPRCRTRHPLHRRRKPTTCKDDGNSVVPIRQICSASCLCRSHRYQCGSWVRMGEAGGTHNDDEWQYAATKKRNQIEVRYETLIFRLGRVHSQAVISDPRPE